ncbi:fatty acid CoA ligase family protein [Flavihumibacter stibioxidans]|uniref:Peptide synthase n=1 Tax=Flavihumibacter stibioxidans TaxID=1834163 RepID=A0ABR7MAH9_9BACT|nr:fatty acid CoA ligase family protein [Flavihumibacter stibioxidans]MBC6492043.1 peptide synthase [Flavihumibacter stibioxidans]
MKPYNIAAALGERAVSQPEALAIAFPEKNSIDQNGITRYRTLNFRELSFETNCVARGLLAAGFEKGDRVLMMVPPGFDFFVLAFAMLQTGIVPVFIDPGSGIGNMKQCISEAAPVGFIGVRKAHVARILLGWGKKSIRKKLTIGARWFWDGTTVDKIRNYNRSKEPAPFFDASENDLAAIIYTSGSTGVPKGVVYTHGNFWAQLELVRSAFHFTPGEIDLPTFPPFALFNPALGLTTIIPDMDTSKPAAVRPQNIIGPILQFNITSMFGSPALIDKVGRYAEANGVQLPSLKRVVSAGAPASTKALARFAALLSPGVEIYTPYGATEAMPITKVGSEQVLREAEDKTARGSGICIGKPVQGIEVAIIRISDEEIPDWSASLMVKAGEIGEIVVKGPNVTHSYFNRKGDTNLAKIRDGNMVRHRMGDLGYFDGEGNLWFCGRKSHRVKAGEEELYSIPVEYIFNQHPRVHRTALVGVNGEPVLCVEMEEAYGRIDRQKLKAELLGLAAAHPMTAGVKTMLFHPGFPVDFRHNAKIIREKLAVWAKNKLA